MSFAPRSRSRERNSFQSGVAAQPRAPIQKEPLHRYGSGIGGPGVSFKGSHQFEGVVVDGRAVTTKLNTNEKPTNLLRSTSPGTLRKPEVLKSDRTYRSKSPLPVTSNTVSLSRSRANSPTGSGTVVPNRTFLEISSKNISNLKRQTSDDASVGSFSISSNNRPNSASSVSSKSFNSSNVRSQIRKSDSFSVIENINQINAFETKSFASRRSVSPSLHRSLSQSKLPVTSPGIHNIQLTQAAYKTVRKAASQDELVDFMTAHRENCAAEDLGEIFETIGAEGKHYIQTLYNSTPPGVKSLSEYRTGSPITAAASGSPSSAAEIRRIKKLLHLSKMCREEIDREMVYYMSHTANNLYFQMENDKSPVVRTAREELYKLVQNNYIPLLNGNLSKIKEAEATVLNDSKSKMNELHAAIDAKEEELSKLTETNNKLKSKVSKFLRKYDVFNSDVFQKVMLESYGKTFTNTIMEQLRNPQLCVPHSPVGSPVNFPQHLDSSDQQDDEEGPDTEAYEIYGLDEHEDHFHTVAAAEPPAPPPVKDRFFVNYDVIQQLANISPQVPSQRVAPDVAPPRRFPASPFVQQHSPNAMVQSVLQGYKSPNATRFLNDVSLSTINTPGTVAAAAGGHAVDENKLSDSLNVLDLTVLADSQRPSQIKSSDMMPHSGGVNAIPNHHVRSQMLYRRSMSPTNLHGHTATTGSSVAGSTSVNVGSSVGVSPSVVHRPVIVSPGHNVRQEVVITPDHQSVQVTKVDYRQLHGMESFAAAQRHSPKMIVRSPPKVPIPSFNTSSTKSPSGRSMMDVMMSNTY